MPTAAVSVCPAWASADDLRRREVGRPRGRLVPAAATAAVGAGGHARDALAVCAVTTTASEWPTSSTFADVLLADRPRDRRAAGARRVAAPPLVRERDRLAARPDARHGGEQLARPACTPTMVGAVLERRGARGIRADRDRRGFGAVQPVAVGAVREAGNGRAVRPLPERPALAAPVLGGDERRGVLRPVRDPEAVAGGGEVGRVADAPSSRSAATSRCAADAGARVDLVEPGARPELQPAPGRACPWSRGRAPAAARPAAAARRRGSGRPGRSRSRSQPRRCRRSGARSGRRRSEAEALGARSGSPSTSGRCRREALGRLAEDEAVAAAGDPIQSIAPFQCETSMPFARVVAAAAPLGA